MVDAAWREDVDEAVDVLLHKDGRLHFDPPVGDVASAQLGGLRERGVPHE